MDDSILLYVVVLVYVVAVYS